MKKLYHHHITVRLLAALIAAYVRVVFATSRVEVITPVPEAVLKGPVVIASWHQQVLMIPVMRRPNPCRLLALISSSRAGILITNVAKWYGIGAIAGSRKSGGTAGARMLIQAARQGNSLYITPDGSRGPARIAKEGASEISRMTRLPLIPCAAWVSRGRTLNTWDSFRFPYPFSVIRVAYAEPLDVLTPEGLSEALNDLSAQVEGISTART